MRLLLAPMQGVVDHHFRELYARLGGLDHCVSEFVRVNDSVVPKRSLRMQCQELNNTKPGYTLTGLPVRLQLLGSNPDTMAASAVNACELGAPGIDLNFGCPAKTVNNSRGGAVLLQDTKLVHRIVASVRTAVPKHIPVTAKIRLGFNDRSGYLDNARAIVEAGATELCVHARSRVDAYNPPAYWNHIAEIRSEVPIPVVANGEIWSAADWRLCQQQSQCTDFMLGRGIMARPDLALQIRAAAQSSESRPMTWQDVQRLVYEYYLGTKDLYPQRHLGNRVKQWMYYLQMAFPEAAAFFEEIKRHRTQAEFERSFAPCQLAA
ncbi:MAG: tRNA-dihydrouridine synthase family protein [Pseudomonadota bacterium]